MKLPKHKLENRPEIVKTVVRYLNAKLKAQFNNLGVSNRTRLVMDTTKVLTKVSLIYKAEGKVKLVTKDVAHLSNIFL